MPQRTPRKPDPSAALFRESLEQLRLKLLDLTGRNRLLNFRHTPGRSLRFVRGSASTIYRTLVEATPGSEVRVVGLPEPKRRDWILRNGRLQRPDPVDWARTSEVPTTFDIPKDRRGDAPAEVLTVMYADDLAKHCRKIHREAKLAIEETGANMLFLVLGLLEHPERPGSEKVFSAPLVCVPVTLNEHSGAGTPRYSLSYTGEDIEENLSLREKVRRDFDLVLPQLKNEDLDVDAYLQAINGLVARQPGFCVRRTVSLCMLSFGNMLLVRDLDPKEWPGRGDASALLSHPIVRQVLGERSPQSTQEPTHAPEPRDLDASHPIPLVFDADSSQHRALVDALERGRNLVIEGPPGTGKSQTITNLIAGCLERGKTVLFLSEKVAALEVVKSRLQQAELGPFVLEMHSNRTSKKALLDALAQRADMSLRPRPGLEQLTRQAEQRSQDLRAYCDALNSIANNSLGLTLHQAIWRSERLRQGLGETALIVARHAIPAADSLADVRLNERLTALDHLAAQFEALGRDIRTSPFHGFEPQNLAPGEDRNLAAQLDEARAWSRDLVSAAESLTTIVGAPLPCDQSPAEGRIAIAELLRLQQDAPAMAEWELLPGLFLTDPTGERPLEALLGHQRKAAQYFQFLGTAKTGLRSGACVTDDSLRALRELRQQMAEAGVGDRSVADLRLLAQAVTSGCRNLTEAVETLSKTAEGLDLPFSGRFEEVGQLRRVASVVLAAPDQHFDLYSPRLAADGASLAIKRFADLQESLKTIRRELAQVAYLDSLPEEAEIRTAIGALREGNAWYRIFQPRWRAAIRCHRSISRKKDQVAAHVRLAQLERVAELLALDRRVRTDSAMLRLSGEKTVPSYEDTVRYLELAMWLKELKAVAEEFGLGNLSPERLAADAIRSVRRAVKPLPAALTAVEDAVRALGAIVPGLTLATSNTALSAVVASAQAFADSVTSQLDWLEDSTPPTATLETVIAACDASSDAQALRVAIESDAEVARLLGRPPRIETDCSGAIAVLHYGQAVSRSPLHARYKPVLLGSDAKTRASELVAALESLNEGLDRVDDLVALFRQFGAFNIDDWVRRTATDDLLMFSQRLAAAIDRASDAGDRLLPWSAYVTRRREAEELSLQFFIELLEGGQIEPAGLRDAYAYAFFNSIVESTFQQNPRLRSFAGLKQSQIRSEFQEVDRKLVSLRGRAVAYRCWWDAEPPEGRNGPLVDSKTEMVLLRHLMPQLRPRMPVRKILARAGQAIRALKPCFMMGPQAVAQFLRPAASPFDVVIMDEASQLRPEEALGAIARGRQLVVVGDSKQLPPTSFFSRGQTPEDDDTTAGISEAESILDVCTGHFHPVRSLRWHYRSRHHSLIAFSNQHFYRGNLIVFPSPFAESRNLGVRAVFLKDATYENQTNVREARRVVDAVVEHIARRPDESLGVATLNIKQRDLIADLLDERLRNTPQAMEFDERWRSSGQPLFVKNLETVQGDERDAIVVSTTFGRPAGSEVVRQNFGPISRSGGWRRLNVLFTRARNSLLVVTSLRPDDIVVDRGTPDGTKALRDYLEFARSGSLSSAVETGREPDSDFEIAVSDFLRLHNYEVTPQLGVSGYRIDLAVRHPDVPGCYLAAVECDGASYHSERSVRDRDRIRQEILESLGWKGRIWRIWSTDWFRTPSQERARLLSFLDELRASWRPEFQALETWVEETSTIPGTVGNFVPEIPGDQLELFPDEEHQEVRVGDVVRYCDIQSPTDVLTVQLVDGPSDLQHGVLNKSKPLAQTILGAAVGDEVTLHLPGATARVFRILSISQS